MNLFKVSVSVRFCRIYYGELRLKKNDFDNIKDEKNDFCLDSTSSPALFISKIVA